MPRLSVQRLFDERRSRLGLTWAAAPEGGEREFTGEMLKRPGVAGVAAEVVAQALGVAEPGASGPPGMAGAAQP